MCSRRSLAAIVLLRITPLAETTAAMLEWRRYAIPATGLSVDVPISIFEEDRGATEGTHGRHLFTKDYRPTSRSSRFLIPTTIPLPSFWKRCGRQLIYNTEE
jgi:hypothetical protein